MAIDLNNEEFNGGGNAIIFNGGTAGIVENVTMKVVRKTPEDKEQAPDYKISFTDGNKGEVNMPFWYITKDTEYKTIQQQIVSTGKVLKHLIHAVYGDTYVMPPFANEKEMLDACMRLLHEACSKGGSYRVYTNYGVKTSPKAFIQVRSWVPFVESMAVAIADTRLVGSDLENMVRVTADSPTSPGATPEAKKVDDDWA